MKIRFINCMYSGHGEIFVQILAHGFFAFRETPDARINAFNLCAIFRQGFPIRLRRNGNAGRCLQHQA